MSRLGTKPGRVRVQPPPAAKQGKIYLGNLPPEGISNLDIELHFATFGSVAEVVRPVDKSPRSLLSSPSTGRRQPRSWSRRDPRLSTASPSPSKRSLPRVFFIDLSRKINISIKTRDNDW